MSKRKKTLKVLRAEKDVTQLQAAELIGVHQQTWRNWENGRTYPDKDQIDKICIAFNVKIQDLKL